MYFDSFQAMLSMDGHGVFVWSAYAITCTVLTVLLQAPWRRKRRLLRRLAGELKRQQGAATVKEES